MNKKYQLVPTNIHRKNELRPIAKYSINCPILSHVQSITILFRLRHPTVFTAGSVLISKSVSPFVHFGYAYFELSL